MSHLLHVIACIIKSFVYHDIKHVVISYHGILCHDMLYITTIAASLIATAFQFYKRHNHSPLYNLSISLKAQPAIGAGRVHRAIFAQVLQQVAEGYLGISEGPPNHLRLPYKMSKIN